MNFTKTIAAAGTFDFPGAIHRLNLLVIENSGANDAYFGAIPPPVFTRYGNSEVADEFVTLSTGSGSTTPDIAASSNAILPGMVISDAGDTNIVAGTKVLYSNGPKVFIDQVCNGNGDGFLLTFTPPALNAATGITIVPGEKVWLTPAQHAAFLQQGFRLYSTAGTTIKFMPKYA